ncbi:DUF5388 domain-containing protein [Lysinibacillus odysseyi]|nr:DUF5388 domain-containing protein [Lysinibacillus odysseyi]
MSNLLNNGKPKKKLLERGPKIVPAQEFKLETEEEANDESSPQEQRFEAKPVVEEAKQTRKRESAQITSVRVTKTTRNKLNALIQLGKADNVDVMIDILLDEYIENNLVKGEKKTFNLILDILQKRDR